MAQQLRLFIKQFLRRKVESAPLTQKMIDGAGIHRRGYAFCSFSLQNVVRAATDYRRGEH